MKREIVKSEQEFIHWLNRFNGKMNCYTTVYDFEHFAETSKVESSVILDRMFLDFDAHGEPLELAFEDFKDVARKLNDFKFDMFFSGKGFHIIVYGEIADDIRSIQSYFTNLAKDYPTLDRTGIQTNRLRRIPNTVNLSSEGPYFCIPLSTEDLELKRILLLAKQRRGLEALCFVGNDKLLNWPEVKPISISDIEIAPPKPPGKLPILPCLYNAIMVENPGHYARVYLAQWYRDLLAMGERHPKEEQQQEIVEIIMSEFKAIASRENVWLDWDERITRHHVSFIVRGGYHAPSCKDKLIPQGYCVGKCWRYCE